MSAALYPISDTIAARERIRKAKKRVPYGWDKVTNQEMSDRTNGIGPGSWSTWKRKVLTWCQQWFADNARIHDVAYCNPDKDRKWFDLANEDFLLNNLQDANDFIWPLSAIIRKNAYLDYEAVHLGGWDAWLAAPEMNLECLRPPEDAGPERMA